MYIDIHRHSPSPGDEVITLQNLFPGQEGQIGKSAFYSAGLHPWHIDNDEKKTEKSFENIRKLLGYDKVIAIGETGLDKSIKTDFGLQQTIFDRHLRLAGDYQKPVIIHCVKAYADMLGFKKQFGQQLPWIMHWFNADEQMAGQLIRKNCYLSFGHMLFKENSKAFKTFPAVPSGRIFLETDDSSYAIQEVYRRAAQLRGISLSKMQGIIKSNFKNCFNINL